MCKIFLKFFFHYLKIINVFIMGWHKNLTEKTLKSLGISNYWALWYAFGLKGNTL